MNIISGIFIVILISAVTALGDICMRLAGSSGKFITFKWFIMGMSLYLATGIGWFLVMKTVKMSSIGVIYGVTTVVLLAVIGVFFFHEKLNFLEIIAIGMGIASIFLLVRFN